jgi:FtsP/CotA-like multicopper oxidase with cupredoxin domain
MATFIWQRRGRFAVALTVLAVFTFWTLGNRYSNTALATSGDNPYSVPLATDDNPDPAVFETTISAEAHTVDIGNGVSAKVLTFNGSVPGPEIRVHVGDTVIVNFENNIAHATGIHWHGIELHNAHDGTPLTQNQVPPGGKYLYKFKVIRPGIYWYHPHHHSSTNQVFKGLYGVFVVTDPDDDTLVANGTLPAPEFTRTLALSDISVCKATGENSLSMEALCLGSPMDEDGAPRGPFSPGDVPNIQPGPPTTSGPVKEGEIVLTNGMTVGGRAGTPEAPGALAAGASLLDVAPGRTLRLQIGSEATVRFFRLRLTGQNTNGDIIQIPIVRIGGQGGLLDLGVVDGGVEPGGFDWGFDEGEVLLDPGDRIDATVTFPANATGVFTMWTKDYARTGGAPPGLPTEPVAHFNITGPVAAGPTIAEGTPILTSIGSSVETLDPPTATLLDPATFSPVKPGMALQDVRLTNTGSSLGINGVLGEHDFPGIDYVDINQPGSTRYAKLGDTLELTVTNPTGAHHPFHLHGFSIQPISLTDTQPGDSPDGAPDIVPATGPGYVFPYKDFRDNVDIPGGYTLTFRVRLDDRKMPDGVTDGGGIGRWVFHCHIFFHASFGMISEFDVVAPDGNERPYIDADGVLLEGNAGDPLTMNGVYKDPDSDTPITLTASTGTITDNGDGLHWTWTGTAATSGFVYVTASDPDGLKGQDVFRLKINQPPVLTVPGPQTADYHDALSFGISATDADGDPITLGASGLPAGLTFTDNGNGTGSVSGTLQAIPAVYIATFSASDGHNAPVTATVEITVTKEETTLAYTGPTVILNGGNVTVTALLTEDDPTPVAGRTVTFTLGAQSCIGVTNASGVASCIIAVSSPLGAAIPITVTFAGDAYYLSSAASATAVVFAFPTRGAFVVGDLSAAGGGTVTWWSSGWSAVNAISGGAAHNSFKGFAGTVTLPTSTPPVACGGPWSTTGGSSPPPTLTAPSFMGVLVTSTTAKSGSIVSGNTAKIVVVQVNPGYVSNAGSLGSGTIVGTFCN